MSDDQSQKDRENERPLSGQGDNQDPETSENQAKGEELGHSSGNDPEKDDSQNPSGQATNASNSGESGEGQQAASPEKSAPEQGQAQTNSDSEAASKASEPEIVTGPADTATSQTNGEAGSASGAGSGLVFATFGPFLLIFFLAAMFWQDLWQHWQGQGLFWQQEAAGLEALQKAMPAGQWLLQVGESASLSNPLPGFYWFAGGLAHVLPWLAPGMICQLAASLATAILLLAVWFLALCAGLGGRSAVASGMVLLCTPLLALSGNLFGPEALACALMLLSLACFSRGWQAGSAWLSLPAGFVLAGLAGLTGGLFHLLLPLVASFILLIWRGTFRRAQGADAIAGFSLMLILVIGWLALTILRVAPQNGLDSLVNSQVQLVWPLARECWWIPAIAAIGLLPWLFLPCCVSWWDRLCNAWGSLKASRKERSGVAFLWISLCLTIACSVFASRPGSPYLTSLPLCLVCLAAPLAGSAYAGLSSIGRRTFYSLVALLMLACGLAMLALSFSISVDVAAGILPEPLLNKLRDLIPALVSLPMLGLAFLIAAIGLAFFFVIRQCQGGLLYCVLVCVAFYQIAYYLLLPNLAASPACELKSLEYYQEKSEAKAMKPAPTEQSAPDQPGKPEPDKAQDSKTQNDKAQDSQPESAVPAKVGQTSSQNSGPAGNEDAKSAAASKASSAVSSPDTAPEAAQESGKSSQDGQDGADGADGAEKPGANGDSATASEAGGADNSASNESQRPVPDATSGEQPGTKSGE